MAESDYILQVVQVSKAFGANKVLKEVNLNVRKGEVHGLIGANGAGKSTLMKIIDGVYTNYEGELYIRGSKVKFKDPWDAQNKGIAMIHQELDLVTNLDVCSNIYLGREKMGTGKISLDRHSMYQEAQELLDSLKFDIQADVQVGKLSPAKQQLILVARCVSMGAEIIIMDEPTSSLSHSETEKLFAEIQKLKEMGKSIIYISHYLEEIFRVCDTVSVLRDGQMITSERIEACTQNKLVEWMVGKKTDIGKKFFRKNPPGDEILTIQDFSQKGGIVQNVSLSVRSGEVLGIAGVVGAGRSELAKLIFGAMPKESGSMKFSGKDVTVKSPRQAVKLGMALIPEDRKTEGMILKRSIYDNICLIDYNNHLHGRFINYQAARKKAEQMKSYMGIVCHSMNQEITSLSGGNQQKAVMGKWLSVRPAVLILDQPTRGVDVGAKKEIYELIHELAEEGTAILLISDELEELINLSDRILVLKKGRVTKEYDNQERSTEKTRLLNSMVN